MMSIRSSKGTGIVTSVPSDSPDDWVALQDLIKKPVRLPYYCFTFIRFCFVIDVIISLITTQLLLSLSILGN